MEKWVKYDFFKHFKDATFRRNLYTSVKKKELKEYTIEDRDILDWLKNFYVDETFLLLSFTKDSKELKEYRLAKISESIEKSLHNQQCSVLSKTEQEIEKSRKYWIRKSIKDVPLVKTDFDITSMMMYNKEMEKVLNESGLNNDNNTFKGLIYRLYHQYGMPVVDIEIYLNHINHGGTYRIMIEESYRDAIDLVENALDIYEERIPDEFRDEYDKKYREELIGGKKTTGRVDCNHQRFMSKARSFKYGMGD